MTHPKSWRNREGYKWKKDHRNIYESKKKWDAENKEVVLPNGSIVKLKDIKKVVAHMKLSELARRMEFKD